jgi:hypothetical protein
MSGRLNVLLLADVSGGLGHEVSVIERMLAEYVMSRNYELKILKMTMEEIRINPLFLPNEFIQTKNGGARNIVFFWEKVVDCRLLYDANILKIFIPHPEIIVEGTLPLLSFVDHIWHKTKLSQEAFKHHARQAAHFFTGFTSNDPEMTVQSFKRFAHFRGKASNRHSAQILNVWRNNPHYPELRYHFYQELNASWEEPFEFKEWLTCRNISILAGKVDRDFYNQQVSECGIHLCLSGVEGFGHYINEARAMGAVVVVIDAPPMNEFIDSKSGILMPASDRREMGLVYRHIVTEEDIKSTIDKIIALPQELLEDLSRSARNRYLSERQLFLARSAYLLDLILHDEGS